MTRHTYESQSLEETFENEDGHLFDDYDAVIELPARVGVVRSDS